MTQLKEISNEIDNRIQEIVGSAVSVGNSKPFSDLLGPSLSQLGVYFGNRTKEWIEGREARRANNVRVHADKVKTIEHITSTPHEPTERQAASLIEWTEEAQKVDPEIEDDLSALWQGILGKIIQNEPDSDEMIAVLKQMNRSDARALLEMRSEKWVSSNDIDSVHVGRLELLGLLSRYGWPQVREQYSSHLLIVAIMAIGLSFFLPVMLRMYPELNPIDASFELIGGLGNSFVVMFLLVTAIGIARRFDSIKLTRLGSRLRETGLKYWKT